MTGAIVKQVGGNGPAMPQLADMALDPNADSLVAISGGGTIVARIDLTTNNKTEVSPAGVSRLGGVVFTPDGRLFVSDRTGSVMELDPQTFAVIRSVVTPPNDDGMTYDPTTGHLFVDQCANAGCGGLLEIDPGTASNPTLTLVNRYPAALGDGLAADGQEHLWLAAGRGLSEFDLRTHTFNLVAAVPGGDDVAPATGSGAADGHRPRSSRGHPDAQPDGREQ